MLHVTDDICHGNALSAPAKTVICQAKDENQARIKAHYP